MRFPERDGLPQVGKRFGEPVRRAFGAGAVGQEPCAQRGKARSVGLHKRRDGGEGAGEVGDRGGGIARRHARPGLALQQQRGADERLRGGRFRRIRRLDCDRRRLFECGRGGGKIASIARIDPRVPRGRAGVKILHEARLDTTACAIEGVDFESRDGFDRKRAQQLKRAAVVGLRDGSVARRRRDGGVEEEGRDGIVHKCQLITIVHKFQMQIRRCGRRGFCVGNDGRGRSLAGRAAGGPYHRGGGLQAAVYRG